MYARIALPVFLGTCKKSPVECCKPPRSVDTARTRRTAAAVFADSFEIAIWTAMMLAATGVHGPHKSDPPIVWIRIRPRTGTSGKRSHCTLESTVKAMYTRTQRSEHNDSEEFYRKRKKNITINKQINKK